MNIDDDDDFWFFYTFFWLDFWRLICGTIFFDLISSSHPCFGVGLQCF